MGRKSKKECIYVYIWLIHFAVQQETNTTLYSNYTWIKINEKNIHIWGPLRVQPGPMALLGLPVIHPGILYVVLKLLSPHLLPRLACELLASRDCVWCMVPAESTHWTSVHWRNEWMVPSSRQCACRAGMSIPGVCHTWERLVSPRTGNWDSRDQL